MIKLFPIGSLVVVDLFLKRERGSDLLRFLKEELPHAVIVLVSGHFSDVDTVVTATKCDADLVLLKPFTLKSLMADVETRLARPEQNDVKSLARVELEHILAVLKHTGGNLSTAARLLGVYRSTLKRRLRKYPPRT